MHADTSEIVRALADSIVGADAALAAEQATKGVDALSETALHPILADGLSARGWGVHRETLYPGDHEPGDTARDRCDLVLTDAPGVQLLDPVHAQRRVRAAAGTLFAESAPTMETEASADAVPPVEAFWIEVKAVAQHAYRDGVPGPNRAYAAEMVNGPAADVCKIMGDGVIERGAAVLVLFTETEDVAHHDLGLATHALLDMGLPIGSPDTVTVPIADRAGNTHATVAAFPLRGLGLHAAFDADTDQTVDPDRVQES